MEGRGRFRTEADKPDFQTCYFNIANDKQTYNKFVSQRINSGEAYHRIQFKIIHLKSKANRGGTFDATEELCDLNKNNGSKGTADKRSIFGTKYESSSSSSNSSGTKSTETFSSGTRGRAKPTQIFSEMIMTTAAVNNNNNVLLLKRTLRNIIRHHRKKGIVQRG